MIQSLNSDPIIYKSFLIGLFIQLLFIVFIIPSFGHLPQQLPLLFSIPWGERQLVPFWILIILPFANVIALFISLIWAIWLFRYQQLLAHIIAAGTTLATILITTSAVKIVLLVRF